MTRNTLPDAIRNKKIVVTGGAGFIGSHLVGTLQKYDPANITVIDKLAHNTKPTCLNTCDFIEQDIGDLNNQALLALLNDTDYLFHLAAEKHSRKAQHDYKTDMAILQTNIINTSRLFKTAAEANIAKVIFTSSLYAYGFHTNEPLHEEMTPAPTTTYGVSKLTGETLLAAAHKQYDLDYATVRLFFVYGPGTYYETRNISELGYRSVILKHIERILQNEPPVIYGNGEQALDYVYIDDVIRALLLCIISNTANHILNIGSGNAQTVNSLTSNILELKESSLEPVHEAPDETEGMIRVCNNTKAKDILDWQPEISFAKGLQNVCHWMSNNA